MGWRVVGKKRVTSSVRPVGKGERELSVLVLVVVVVVLGLKQWVVRGEMLTPWNRVVKVGVEWNEDAAGREVQTVCEICH